MKAELVPDNGDPPIRITRDLTVVGRRGFCDVVVDHPSLSKRHCVLVKTDGLLVVRDLASTNGTKVRGQRVRWAALLPEDRLTLGGCKFRVYLGPDDAPGPSELLGKGAAAAASPKAAPKDDDKTGFAPPSPLETPTMKGLTDWPEDDADSDSGWRDQIGSLAREDDVIIELD